MATSPDFHYWRPGPLQGATQDTVAAVTAKRPSSPFHRIVARIAGLRKTALVSFICAIVREIPPFTPKRAFISDRCFLGGISGATSVPGSCRRSSRGKKTRTLLASCDFCERTQQNVLPMLLHSGKPLLCCCFGLFLLSLVISVMILSHFGSQCLSRGSAAA